MSDTEYEPLKGDPDLLASKARHYLDIADAIARSVNTLHKIHDVDDMQSKATEKLKESSDDVANDIDKAHDRYQVTANALLAYSSTLRTAQEKANSAITLISSRQSTADSANAEASRTQTAADDATGTDATAATTKATTAHSTATEANKELAAAQQAWAEARSMKDTAAHTAAQAIIEVVDKHNNGLENPGFWEQLGEAVLDIVKKICEIASILSIFLSWVPILGEVLIALAILGAVITLVESIVAFANGGSFTNVLFAAAGLVLTAFGGKLIGYLGKLAKFKAAKTAMTEGQTFLNSRKFKAAFDGVSKTKLKTGELKNFFTDGPGFKTMLKEVRNPFDSGLGNSSNVSTAFKTGFKTGFKDFTSNPLGLSSLGKDAKYAFNGDSLGTKIAFRVNDLRSVSGTADTLYNEGDKGYHKIFGGDEHPLPISTDSLMAKGANRVEQAIRG